MINSINVRRPITSAEEEWKQADYSAKTCPGTNEIELKDYNADGEFGGHLIAPPNWDGHMKYNSYMACSWLIQSDDVRPFVNKYFCSHGPWA